MVEHIWSVLCSRAVIDRDTNNATLIDVVEQIVINGIPQEPGSPALILPAMMNLVSLWRREDADRPVQALGRVRLRSPGGDVIKDFTFPIDLQKAPRSRINGKIAGLPVPMAGTYRFLVEWRENEDSDWQQVASIPLEVVFKPEDPPKSE